MQDICMSPTRRGAKRKVLAKTEPELVWFRRKRLAVKYFMFRMLQNVGDKAGDFKHLTRQTVNSRWKERKVKVNFRIFGEYKRNKVEINVYFKISGIIKGIQI